VFEATIEKIEFLGAYCHVHVNVTRAGGAQAHRVSVAQLFVRAVTWSTGSSLLKLRLAA
jgi:hypothetical protein